MVLLPTTHPAVYQYVIGGKNSKTSAIMRATNIVFEYTNPYWMGDDSFTLEFTRGVVRQYLEFLENEYKRGKIKVKEIYQKHP
jgi:hypothetical protein